MMAMPVAADKFSRQVQAAGLVRIVRDVPRVAIFLLKGDALSGVRRHKAVLVYHLSCPSGSSTSEEALAPKQ
jgi:hypothetical protein